MRREGWQHGWVFNKNNNDFMYVRKPQKALMTHLARKQQQQRSAPVRRKNRRRDGNSELYDWSVCGGRRGFLRGSPSAVADALFRDDERESRWAKVILERKNAASIPGSNQELPQWLLDFDSQFPALKVAIGAANDAASSDDDESVDDEAFESWEAEETAAATAAIAAAADSAASSGSSPKNSVWDEEEEDDDDDVSWSWSSIASEDEDDEFVEITAQDWTMA